MIQTIIICLSVVLIVALICYTCYKIHTYKASSNVLDDIQIHLDWLKSDYKINSDWIEQIWDNIQELKSYLRK